MLVQDGPGEVNSKPVTKPVQVDNGLYGPIKFSSQKDTQLDGSQTNTLDNGTGPSGQPIRVGTLMFDPTWVHATGRGLFSEDVNSILNISF